VFDFLVVGGVPDGNPNNRSMGKTTLRHTRAGVFHSARISIHRAESYSGGNSYSLSFLRQEPLHAKLDLQMQSF
jgi:hypothetical protein